MITDPSQRHDTIAAAVLAAFVGLACLGALLQAVLRATAHSVLVGVALAGLVLLFAVVRWAARAMRERREDATDALTGAAWRVHNLPDHDRAEVA